MKSIRLVSLSLVALAASPSLFACGGSEDEGTPDGPGTDGPGNMLRAQEVNCTTAVTKEITNNDMTSVFMPATMAVAKGTVVRFKNSGSHDVKSRDNLFLIVAGDTECVKFNEPGTYIFDCRIHSFMGTVTVQ